MAIKTLLGVLVGVAVLAAIGGIFLAATNTARGRSPRPGVLVLIVAVVAFLILAPLNAGLVLIEPGQMGVIFRQTASGDAALLEPRTIGLTWVVPFVDQVEIYDVANQSVTMAGSDEASQATQHGSVRAVTKDGQQINLDVTVIYRIDPKQINSVHRNWRGTYQDGFIVPRARSEVRNAASLYSAEEIYSGGRAELEAKISGGLSGEYEQEGFILTDFLIRDVSFSPEFTQAIEQKQIAQQQAEQAAFRVQQAKQEAEQARVEAQGKADASVIASQGEAQGITIKASAQAEALAKINEILAKNPNLIQWQYINQLGDQVRLIIVPSNSPFLFNLQDLLAQSGASNASGQPIPTPSP